VTPLQNACCEIDLSHIDISEYDIDISEYDLDFSKPPFSYSTMRYVKKVVDNTNDVGIIKNLDEPEYSPGECSDFWKDGDW